MQQLAQTVALECCGFLWRGFEPTSVMQTPRNANSSDRIDVLLTSPEARFLAIFGRRGPVSPWFCCVLASFVVWRGYSLDLKPKAV